MKTTMQKFVLSAFVLLASTSSFAATQAYCTGGSATGYDWFMWTNTNQDAACGTVFKKILGAGHAVNRAYWGSYNTTGQNNAKLICNQGTKSVVGYGADVFTNAANMRSQLGWFNCGIQMQ